MIIAARCVVTVTTGRKLPSARASPLSFYILFRTRLSCITDCPVSDIKALEGNSMSEDGAGNKRPRSEDVDPNKGDADYLQQLTAEQV
jgi:hypothetical protein